MKFLIVDVETTGLDSQLHEPTQVAALLLDAELRELAAFAPLMRPQHPERVTSEALAIHGRTMADFQHAMEAPQAFALLAAFVSAAGDPPVVVGHNVGLDLEFLTQAELRHGQRLPGAPIVVDTSNLARVHLQAQGLTVDAKLTTLSTHHGIAHQVHDALGDVRATARVLARIRADAPEMVVRALAGDLLTGLIRDAYKAIPANPFVGSCGGQLQAKGYLSAKQIGARVRIAHA